MVQGRTALVTGSTSGIGYGIAESFAGAGAHVVLNGFGDKEEIESLRKGLAQRHGVAVTYSDADMSDPTAIETMIRASEDRFGQVDILVNNAGIQHVALIEDFPPEKWAKVIDINLSHVFYTMHYALPKMRAAGWGRIINIASAHGLVASAKKSAYVAAKHGVVGLTKVTALETAGSGITCNTICPGWVLTPLVQQQIDANAAQKGISVAEAEKELLGEKQPAMEFVTPEQIGAYAVFLCSEAARTVTGAQVQIDGGWTAH